MSLEQIHSLLQQSTVLYQNRSIEEAIGIAQTALELSGKNTYLRGMIHSNLLLGQFHNTAAEYLGDRTILSKALDHLQRALQLNEAPSENGHTIDILLALGDTHQKNSEYKEAEKYYQKALAGSRQQNDLPGEIRALCAESQLAIHRNDFQKARELADHCLSRIQNNESRDPALMAETYNQLTQICIKRQDYGSLLEFCEPLLRISRQQNDVEKELNALKNLATYYGVQTDYKRAMQYLLEALEKSKAINYRKITAQCLVNIGTIYAHFYNHEEALVRYQTALKEYDDVMEANNRAIVINNVGNIYFKTDRAADAKDYFQRALVLAESVQYREMIALSKAQLSRSYIALENIDRALQLAEEAQEIIQELGDVNGRQINSLNLGKIQYLQKNYEEAIILTSQGIVASKRLKDKEHETLGYRQLSQLYEQLKDFEKALQYQRVYSEYQKDFAKEQRERRVMDLEIKYAIEEKQKEIEQLTKENKFQALLLEQKDQIVKQNAQLLQANEELRQFAYVASHDLKEPLRMIGSYTQLIFRKHGLDFDKDSKSYFDFVSEGVNRMNNLLDALLRYATIGKTDEEFEEVRLNDAIELAVINLRVRIEETEAEINIPQLPVVRSIQSLLIQLFQNLISNALKFRKPEVRPVVNIQAREELEEIIVSIEDNGIGIAPEYQERIFVIFQRLHTRAKYEGTGIGLSICLKIIQRLGGRIWVESEVGQGAAFFVALPRNR